MPKNLDAKLADFRSRKRPMMMGWCFCGNPDTTARKWVVNAITELRAEGYGHVNLWELFCDTADEHQWDVTFGQLRKHISRCVDKKGNIDGVTKTGVKVSEVQSGQGSRKRSSGAR